MNRTSQTSILLLRLSSARDTAASSTHLVLADLARAAAPEAELDFAFLPPARAPRVRGHATGRDWAAFDLVLVTNAYVLEALNLPWLLHAGGLPPWAPDRPESFPPLLLGGSNALAAQCLARPDGAAVPDAFFFGEAEEALPAFLRRWLATGGPKRARLAAAADGLDGFWVTGAPPPRPVRQAVCRAGRLPPPAPHPPPDTAGAGTARLAVSAGCASFCSFCFEGYERKPYREYAPAEILDHARRLKAARGARAVELDAFNLNTHAALAALVEPCARLFETVSFKSQRADGIAACPALIDLERAAGKSSFTLGIEGVSARMRAFLCKSLDDDAIAAAVQALLDRRVRELKLFFILTAHEDADDLAAFGDFCSRLRGWLDRPRACTRVILSFGRLVRMPHTPLARDRLALDEAEWRFATDGVAAACRRNRLELRFATAWPDYLATQLLAACGHADAEAVVRLACEGLACHAPWREAEVRRLRAALAPAAAPREPPFPFVRRAVSDAFLDARWEEARRFRDAGACLGGRCGGCGACVGEAERRALAGHARAPTVPDATVAAVARVEADKRRLAPLDRRAVLPASLAGRSPDWLAARLMQHLLTRHPELTDDLLSVDEALFGHGDNRERLPLPAGPTAVRFRAWSAAPLLAALAREPELFPDEPLPAAFEPGRFARASWRVLTPLAAREAAQLASAWLLEQRLPHTLRRDGASWRADLAPAAAKRKTVFALAASDGTLALDFSPKADVAALLRRLPPDARCVCDAWA